MRGDFSKPPVLLTCGLHACRTVRCSLRSTTSRILKELSNKPPGFAHTVGSTRVGRMGLATLRRNGWTCLETTDREMPGWAVTEPIEVTDRNVRLVLNVSEAQPFRSFVKVEILDAVCRARRSRGWTSAPAARWMATRFVQPYCGTENPWRTCRPRGRLRTSIAPDEAPRRRVD